MESERPPNPYRPPIGEVDPSTPGVPDSRVHVRTRAGSELTIGPRRRFVASWIWANAFVTIAFFFVLMHPVHRWSARLSWELVASTHQRIWLYLDLPVFLLGWFLVPILYTAGPPLARPADGAVPAEIRFDPRLSGTTTELRDTADDFGWTWFEGGDLRFLGDRTDLRLVVADVEAVTRRWTMVSSLLAWSPGIRVALRDPIAGTRMVTFSVRSTFRTPATWRAARSLERATSEWARSDARRRELAAAPEVPPADGARRGVERGARGARVRPVRHASPRREGPSP